MKYICQSETLWNWSGSTTVWGKNFVTALWRRDTSLKSFSVAFCHWYLLQTIFTTTEVGAFSKTAPTDNVRVTDCEGLYWAAGASLETLRKHTNCHLTLIWLTASCAFFTSSWTQIRISAMWVSGSLNSASGRKGDPSCDGCYSNCTLQVERSLSPFFFLTHWHFVLSIFRKEHNTIQAEEMGNITSRIFHCLLHWTISKCLVPRQQHIWHKDFYRYCCQTKKEKKKPTMI